MAVAGRGADKFLLRLPAGMREQLKAAAKKNGRSLNSQIVWQIEQSLLAISPLAELQKRVERLERASDR